MTYCQNNKKICSAAQKVYNNAQQLIRTLLITLNANNSNKVLFMLGVKKEWVFMDQLIILLGIIIEVSLVSQIICLIKYCIISADGNTAHP